MVGCLASDGRIYCGPAHYATRVLCIGTCDGSTKSVTLIGPDLQRFGQWLFHCCLVRCPFDGMLYGMHHFTHGKIFCVSPAPVFQLKSFLAKHPNTLKSWLSDERQPQLHAQRRSETLSYLADILASSLNPASLTSDEIDSVRTAVKQMGPAVATSPELLRTALDLRLMPLVRELTSLDGRVMDLSKACLVDPKKYFPLAVSAMVDRVQCSTLPRLALGSSPGSWTG